MEEKPFAKISISDICERCDMNRKSFYYHFKDKYDLINWIFDTECIAIANQDKYDRRVDILLELCRYFYKNHSFYRNALQVRGQNSFLEHFNELTNALAITRLNQIFGDKEMPDFCVNFLADGFTCAIVRWITAKEPVSPEDFVDSLVDLIKGISIFAYELIKKRQEENSKRDCD